MAKSLRNGFCRLVLAAVFAALVHACAASSSQGPLLLHPVPPEAEGYELAKGASVFESPGLRVMARPLDWRVVEERLEREGLINPFGAEEGILSQLVFISLRLENHSSETLTFDSLRAKLSTDNEEEKTPLDLTDLHIATPEAEDLKERGRAFRQISYDGTISIEPGESRERYLVYPSPQDKLKTLELILEDIYLGYESITLTFPFEAFRTDPAEKGDTLP